jgi:hypothetical protein
MQIFAARWGDTASCRTSGTDNQSAARVESADRGDVDEAMLRPCLSKRHIPHRRFRDFGGEGVSLELIRGNGS